MLNYNDIDFIVDFLGILPGFVRSVRVVNANAETLLPEIVERLGIIFKIINKRKEYLGENISVCYQDICEALLASQENEDMVLFADIVESDLIPLMQQLYSCFEEDSDRKESNLGRNDLVSCKALNGMANGMVVCDGKQAYLHSSIDPMDAARLLAMDIVRDNQYRFGVLGLGLGYETVAILEENPLTKVDVFEYDKTIYEMAFDNFDFSVYGDRLNINLFDDIADAWNRLAKSNEDGIYVLEPQLSLSPNKEAVVEIKKYVIEAKNYKQQSKRMMYNFTRIQDSKIEECEALKGIVEGKKTLVIGGGPSLNEVADAVRNNRDSYAIIATGRSVSSLASYGINPDIIVISDSKVEVSNQLVNFAGSEVPLVLLSTACSDFLDTYEGKIYVAYQEGYDLSEKIANEKGYYKYQVGGSVSLVAIDMAYHFSAGEIILSGMDMGYTDGKYYADGNEAKEVGNVDLYECFTASNAGNEIPTTHIYMMYKKKIEARIEMAHQDPLERKIKVFNTGKGARIEGTQLMKLS